MEAKAQNAERADRAVELREVLGGLVRDGHVGRDQARPLIATHRPDSGPDAEHPLESVARRHWKSAVPPHEPLSLERLTRWFAERVAIPYFRIDPLKIDAARVTEIVSFPYAHRFQILPVAVDGQRVTVATCQPWVREWEQELTRILRVRIDRVVANPADIRRYLREFYNVSRSIREASAAAPTESLSGVLNLEQLIELGRADKLEPNDRHIVNIVDWLLQYAFEQRASDIHLEPRRGSADVRFRIDGVLRRVNELPAVVMAAVTSRIKAIGRMDLVEKRRPQDGRLKTRTPAGQEVELRLSTMPTAFGEKLVLRIFDPQVLQRSFSELGLSVEDNARWQGLIERPKGIVLVTGPTGSGKTTTLYSALRKLAQPEVNVCTIEDPIEMIEPAFNQMQVQTNIGVDFADGVRNLLRQDPDIMMVGEIRDGKTAEMAIQASLTGHLVLSTLHTNDAPSAITRLLDIGAPPYLLRATLNGVMAQRLVRTLCPHCKKPAGADELDWGDLRSRKLPDGATLFKAVGCDECRNTGYRGRIGLYEILPMSPALRRQVVAEVDSEEIRRIALAEGMHSLRDSGFAKVCAGLTCAEEIGRVAPAVEEQP